MSRGHAIPRRCPDADLRAQAAVADFGADVSQPRDRQDAGTVGRYIDGSALVARRGDHQHAHAGELRHQTLIAGGTAAGAAETQVDDIGWVRIVRHGIARTVGNRHAHRPHDSSDDVRVQAAAFTERTHRQQVGIPGHARDADIVVGQRAEQTHDSRAVPRAVRGAAILAREYDGVLQVGAVDPIARIRRIGIPTIAVVGHEKRSQRRTVGRVEVLADKIIARQQTPAESRPQEIRVIEANSAVDIRNHRAGAPLSNAPRGDRVRGRRVAGGRRRAGRLHVPLTAGRGGRHEQGIIRQRARRVRIAAFIDIGKGHRGVRAQLLERGGHLSAVQCLRQQHHMHARRKLA